MKKIPTLFTRGIHYTVVPSYSEAINPDDIIAARATRKWDGTACKIDAGLFLKRRVVPVGDNLPPFFHKEEVRGGAVYGWVPVTIDDPWHVDALHDLVRSSEPLPMDDLQIKLGYEWMGSPQTFELVGPKVQGGIERVYSVAPHGHALIVHGATPYSMPKLTGDPRADFDIVRAAFLQEDNRDTEGCVWMKPDGTFVAKAKLRDFGIKRRKPEESPLQSES